MFNHVEFFLEVFPASAQTRTNETQKSIRQTANNEISQESVITSEKINLHSSNPENNFENIAMEEETISAYNQNTVAVLKENIEMTSREMKTQLSNPKENVLAVIDQNIQNKLKHLKKESINSKKGQENILNSSKNSGEL